MEPFGQVEYYQANELRTAVMGQPSSKVKEMYDVTREMFEKGATATRPGVLSEEIDRISHGVCVKAGYEHAHAHRSGFGMGMSIGAIAQNSVWYIMEGDKHVLKPGMQFSLEPTLTIWNFATTMCGSNILVTEDGHEVLHKYPRELIIK